MEEMKAVFDDAQAAQCGVNGRTPAVAFVEGGETTRKENKNARDAARSLRNCQPITLSVHTSRFEAKGDPST
jgi:hypothetical protein